MTATSPKTDDMADQRPLGELIGNITHDLSQLFRQEVELAKAEMRQEGKKAAGAAAMMAAGAVAALLTLVLVSFALVYLLAEAMHIALAALLVGVVWAIAGAVLISAGRKRMRTVTPLPKTTETMKENARWLQNPTG